MRGEGIQVAFQDLGLGVRARLVWGEWGGNRNRYVLLRGSGIRVAGLRFLVGNKGI